MSRWVRPLAHPQLEHSSYEWCIAASVRAGQDRKGYTCSEDGAGCAEEGIRTDNADAAGLLRTQAHQVIWKVAKMQAQSKL